MENKCDSLYLKVILAWAVAWKKLWTKMNSTFKYKSITINLWIIRINGHLVCDILTILVCDKKVKTIKDRDRGTLDSFISLINWSTDRSPISKIVKKHWKNLNPTDRLDDIFGNSRHANMHHYLCSCYFRPILTLSKEMHLYY